ncbi:MarR family winged helix-turn-helix transcriptional regulator [Roseibium aestuarii]|uniref:MarR family winged helix-turn-helix transcriptional regulator n=1 Tax=Roseibium aestuarii TaxID=2600299 RepID=A0ABW4K0T0_9HYPH|nr:MarR family transcriptional regulator [Roseibium aestuarii]
MAFNYKKSATFRLTQASKAMRARSGAHLMRIGLHPGQELVLKVLAETDGRTMSQLALALGVQPPTVTKMVTRLSAQGYLRRQVSDSDGRLARVYLTDEGRGLVEGVDKAWKRLEREAMAGLDDKDRKKLRKLLRQVEKNLNLSVDPDEDDAEAEAEEASTVTTVSGDAAGDVAGEAPAEGAAAADEDARRDEADLLPA